VGAKAVELTLTNPVALQSGDEHLIGRVAAGDSRAVVCLYREHAREIYRFIARRVESPVEDIEEILQDTMLAAVVGASSFRRQCSLRTWLCGIARNQILQRRRTDLRKKRIPASRTVFVDEATLDAIQAARCEGCSSDGDLAEQLFTREMVFQILSKLEEGYREVLLLRYVEEFSIRDIAQLWNRSERAVEGVLRRARQRAKQIGAEYQ